MAYTEKQKTDIINEVCSLLENGQSVRQALKNEGMPQSSTFFEWLKSSSNFSEQYARACEMRSEAIFEEILTIADNQEADVLMVDGKEVTNHNVINRSRLRVDARKWMLGKMQPKKYGDKLDLTTDGESMNMSADEKEKRIQALLLKAKK